MDKKVSDKSGSSLQNHFKRYFRAATRASAEFYPLGRIATSEEVAKAALFLASDDAAFITGQLLEISGGARI